MSVSYINGKPVWDIECVMIVRYTKSFVTKIVRFGVSIWPYRFHISNADL